MNTFQAWRQDRIDDNQWHGSLSFNVYFDEVIVPLIDLDTTEMLADMHFRLVVMEEQVQTVITRLDYHDRERLCSIETYLAQPWWKRLFSRYY